VLAERRGQMVSRTEIAERLWSKDVFVDVENGINTAIRKVRRALQGPADSPRHYAQCLSAMGDGPARSQLAKLTLRVDRDQQFRRLLQAVVEIGDALCNGLALFFKPAASDLCKLLAVRLERSLH